MRYFENSNIVLVSVVLSVISYILLCILLTTASIIFRNSKGGGGINASASSFLNKAVGSNKAITVSRVSIITIAVILIVINIVIARRFGKIIIADQNAQYQTKIINAAV